MVKRVSNGLVGAFDLMDECPGRIGEGSVFQAEEVRCAGSPSGVAESDVRPVGLEGEHEGGRGPAEAGKEGRAPPL